MYVSATLLSFGTQSCCPSSISNFLDIRLRIWLPVPLWRSTAPGGKIVFPDSDYPAPGLRSVPLNMGTRLWALPGSPRVISSCPSFSRHIRPGWRLWTLDSRHTTETRISTSSGIRPTTEKPTGLFKASTAGAVIFLTLCRLRVTDLQAVTNSRQTTQHQNARPS